MLYAIRLLVLFLISVCFSFQQGNATAKPDDSNETKRDLQPLASESIVFTKRNERSPFEGVIELPPLKCDQRYQLILSMSTAETSFVFDDVDTGCNCCQIKLSEKQVGNDNSTEAVITFITRKSHVHNMFGKRIDFTEKGKTTGHLYLKYRLSDNLHLTPSSVYLEVTDEGFSERKIPFVCDSSVKDIECELSENLREHVDVQIKMDGPEKGHVLLSPAADFFMRSTIVPGKLSLKSSMVPTKTSMPLQLHQKPEVDFSPNNIYFVKDESGEYVGSVMMRVSDNKDIDDVKIRIDGLDADIEVKKLNDKIAKLRVRLRDVDEAGKRSGDFSWVYTIRTISGSEDAKWQR